MALVHSKTTVVKLGSNDLSQYTKTSEFSQEADSHDVTVYGQGSKAYAVGLKDATLTLEGFYDGAATGPRKIIQPLIGGATIVFTRQPEGTGTGKPQDVVTTIVTSYVESAPVADMITWKAEFQCTGDVNSAVQV